MLRDIAEQFQTWPKAWAGKRNIPAVEAPQGRRDDFVDPYFNRTKPDEGVVILKGRVAIVMCSLSPGQPATLSSARRDTAVAGISSVGKLVVVSGWRSRWGSNASVRSHPRLVRP